MRLNIIKLTGLTVKIYVLKNILHKKRLFDNFE